MLQAFLAGIATGAVLLLILTGIDRVVRGWRQIGGN